MQTQQTLPRSPLGGRLTASLTLIGSLLALSGPVTGQVGALERFVVPGADITFAQGVDSAGRIVGGYNLLGGPQRAYLRSSVGSFQLLDWPGATTTWFEAINDFGVVLGFTAGAPYGGPLEYAGGIWSPLTSALFGSVFPTGLNDAGLAVANFIDAFGGHHGAVLAPAGETVVDYPGADRTELGDVNDLGIAVGSYRTGPSSGWRGMLYDTNTATFTALDMPGAVDLMLYGINDAGEVVGEALFADGTSTRRAVHYDGAQWRVLALFGQTDLGSARDIADDGTICGTLRGYHLGTLRLLGFVERRVGGGPRAYCPSAVNSTGAAADIHYQGSVSVAANDLVLEAGPCPPGEAGLFFYGATRTEQPFGDGVLCVAAPRFRLGISSANAQGYAVAPIDLNAPPTPAGQVTPGSRWHFQYWYRDPAAQGSGFNTSAGLRVDFAP